MVKRILISQVFDVVQSGGLEVTATLDVAGQRAQVQINRHHINQLHVEALTRALADAGIWLDEQIKTYDVRLKPAARAVNEARIRPASGPQCDDDDDDD